MFFIFEFRGSKHDENFRDNKMRIYLSELYGVHFWNRFYINLLTNLLNFIQTSQIFYRIRMLFYSLTI